MKVETKLIKATLPTPHEVYWNIDLPEIRLTINVYKKKETTRKRAKELVEYLKGILEKL